MLTSLTDERLSLLLSLMETSALAQSFPTISRVDGWLIERKRDSEQNHVCGYLFLVVDPGSLRGFASISMMPL
tara:strand:- start:1300 stop:1518 length:219 start_codon:yes stop_codon:yes gene_type:complete